MSATNIISPTSQFDIKFYTKNEFQNITEREFKIPDVKLEDKLAMDFAIGVVRYDCTEDGVVIHWNPLKDHTMAKMLGRHLLMHDNTSFAIFSSLITHLQKQFYSKILFEESFKLYRLPEYDVEGDANVCNYDKSGENGMSGDIIMDDAALSNRDGQNISTQRNNLVNSVAMKHSARKELKYLYGRITLPLIYYVFTLKSKIDINVLNTFYNDNQEISDIVDAAAAAPEETLNNSHAQPDIGLTFTQNPHNFINSSGDIIGQTFTQSPSQQQQYMPNNIHNKRIESDVSFTEDEDEYNEYEEDGGESNEYYEDPLISTDLNKTEITKNELDQDDIIMKTLNKLDPIYTSTPIIKTESVKDIKMAGDSKNIFDSTGMTADSKCLLSDCSKSKKKKMKRKHRQTTNPNTKKRLFDYEDDESDYQSTDTSTTTSTGESSTLFEQPIDQKLVKIKSSKSSVAGSSGMSSFNAGFNSLAIDQSSLLSLMNKFYIKHLRSNAPLNRVNMIKEWESVITLMSDFKNNYDITDSDIEDSAKEIQRGCGGIFNKQYYDKLYKNAQVGDAVNTIVLYSYITLQIKNINRKRYSNVL